MLHRVERLFLGLNLAARNLARHKRRTLQTLAVVAVGLIAVTLLDGFITFQLQGLEHRIIRSGTGTLEAEVSQKAFDEVQLDPFSYLIPHSAAVIKNLRRNLAVDDALPAFPFSGVAATAEQTLTLQVLALPTLQARSLLSARNLVSGSDLPDQPSGKILLGVGAADKLGVHPGDQLILYAMAAGGGVNEDTFQVAGTETSGITAADASSAWIDLADAQRLMGTQDVPQILVFLTHNSQASLYQKQWSSAFPGSSHPLVWKRWDELSPYWQQASGSLTMVLSVARLIVLLIAVFSVAGALTLSVLERLRETGTVRAFGVPQNAVLLQFVLEGLLLGAVGSGLGTLLGLGVCGVLNLVGGVAVPAPGMSGPIDVLFTPSSAHFLENIFFLTAAAGLGAFLTALWSTRQSTAALLRAL